MAVLHIADFPDEVLRACKQRAFDNRVTLRQYVIEKLGGDAAIRPATGYSKEVVEHRATVQTSASALAEPKPAKKSRFDRLPVMGEK